MAITFATIDRAIEISPLATARMFRSHSPEQLAAGAEMQGILSDIRDWLGAEYVNADALDMGLISVAAKQLMAEARSADLVGGYVIHPFDDEPSEVVEVGPEVDADHATIRLVRLASGRECSVEAGAIWATPEAALWAQDYYARAGA